MPVEVAPFVGIRFGRHLRREGETSRRRHRPAGKTRRVMAWLPVSVSMKAPWIEFRWTRSTSTLRFDAPLGFVGTSLGDVTLDQFHGDFTREWFIPEVKGLGSFLTGSVGATHIAAAHDGFTRFSFGLGAGLKQFLAPNLRDTRRSEMAANPDRAGSQLMGVWRGRCRWRYRGPHRASRATVRAQRRACRATLTITPPARRAPRRARSPRAAPRARGAGPQTRTSSSRFATFHRRQWRCDRWSRRGSRRNSGRPVRVLLPAFELR